MPKKKSCCFFPIRKGVLGFVMSCERTLLLHRPLSHAEVRWCCGHDDWWGDWKDRPDGHQIQSLNPGTAIRPQHRHQNQWLNPNIN